MKKEKSTEDVKKFAIQVAKFRGWKLNGDMEFLDAIFEGHRRNYTQLGYYACPCRETFGEREKDRDIICPCEYAQPDIEEFGHCYCALFMSEEFAITGKEAESIPERRLESRMP